MTHTRISNQELTNFCRTIFLHEGLSAEEAEDSAEILVAADARGIGSHGTARLRRYINGIRQGIMIPGTQGRVLKSTPISTTVDAEGAIGLHISRRVMADTVERAAEHGAGLAAVRDSNHFGIAGYYAMMALPRDMIGIAMTNTAALGVPTFARDRFFGTNPLAVAVPAEQQPAFVLDMSTTTVTRGKIETYRREGQPLPEGWAVGQDGQPTRDAEKLLDGIVRQLGGGILPLGGLGEIRGGHKGYGLAAMVDIFTAVLSGGTFGQDVSDAGETAGRVCHFFAALRLDLFRDPKDVKRDMDQMLQALREAPPAQGHSQVYYAGFKEYLHEQECAQQGIPLPEKVWQELQEIGAEVGVTPPKPV